MNLLKEQIVSYGRGMLADGLVASTWGNISVKHSEDKILITPSGMEYDKLKAEDIVLIDSLGHIISGSRKPSSELKMHLEIYKNRPEINAVIHTHSIFCSAYAVCHKAIPPLIEDMAQVVGGQVDVAKYALPGTEELAQNVIKALENKGAVLLANHGVVGVGKDLEEAYKVCLLVEKTAHIGIAAANLGNLNKLSDEDVQWMHKMYLNYYGQQK